MRLFDAIVEANHRASRGDQTAGLRVADYTDELPVVALTCIDPRLNRFFPSVLGLPEQQFIWLRNAGNVITSSLSSTMRSLALACAIKGGREIAVIGHTDCQVRKTTVSELMDHLKALGIERRNLPENLIQYFGLFASEQQNVIAAVDFIRQSPLIGPKIPVQGLIVETDTGKLQWIVNGYQALERPAAAAPASATQPGLAQAIGQWGSLAAHEIEQLKFPQAQIGEVVTKAGQLLWSSEAAQVVPPEVLNSAREAATDGVKSQRAASGTARPPAPPSPPRPIPVPPPIQPAPRTHKRR